MIIIGDALVPYEHMFRIYHKEQIAESQPNSTIIFKYNDAILEYASSNALPFAVMVDSIKEAIYVNACKGKYIIASASLAKEIQKVAENYMFDAKVLCVIESNDAFEAVAQDEIDGVIYKHILG